MDNLLRSVRGLVGVSTKHGTCVQHLRDELQRQTGRRGTRFAHALSAGRLERSSCSPGYGIHLYNVWHRHPSSCCSRSPAADVGRAVCAGINVNGSCGCSPRISRQAAHQRRARATARSRNSGHWEQLFETAARGGWLQRGCGRSHTLACCRLRRCVVARRVGARFRAFGLSPTMKTIWFTDAGLRANQSSHGL